MATPRARGLKPAYGSLVGPDILPLNEWMHLVSDADSEPQANTPIHIHTDANISVALVTSVGLQWELTQGRQAYLLALEGGVSLSSSSLGQSSEECMGREELNQHDAAELRGPVRLEVKSKDALVHCLLVEMANDGSSRF